MEKVILEALGISKLFSGVVALQDVNFTLMEGEVHALMGENGAGKSTLSKIIAGILRSNGGKLSVRGEECSFCSTIEARWKGIAIVTQEFSLLPDFSIAENIFITNPAYYKHAFLKNRSKMLKDTVALLKLFNMQNSLKPYTKVNTLSVAQCQVIEILKAVSSGAEIIILDEPTASLSSKEIDQLFELILTLKGRGMSFIIVSHKIQEIYAISDRITVLRDGRGILDGVRTCELGQKELIKAMVGREVNDLYGSGLRRRCQDVNFQSSEIVFEAKDVSAAGGRVRHASFKLCKGQIVGFSGLIGAGRSEFMRSIFGADRRISGEVFLHGKKLDRVSIRKMMCSGIAYVSEDRKQEGLVQNMNVVRNINLAKLVCTPGFLLNRKREDEDCSQMIRKFNIKVPGFDALVKTLSGGNQQKVLLGKWMLIDPEVLIVDEPTRGIDIGAKADIYAILRDLAGQGISIVMVSSEIPEILGICDYVYIMREGRLTGAFPVEELDEEKIGYYSTLG